MRRETPMEMYSTETLEAPEYQGIHMDAFFFVRDVVGLPAKPAVLLEEDENISFSTFELTTMWGL